MNQFIPSALLVAALALTGCSGTGSTEGESQPGESRIPTGESPAGTAPSDAGAGAPQGPYGGGYKLGTDGGESDASDAGANEGPAAEDGDSSDSGGNAAGGGTAGNPGAETADAPDEKDAAADDSATSDAGGVSDGAEAAPEDPGQNPNGTDSPAADNPDAAEGNEKSSHHDAAAGAAMSGAFKNMSKACKAISAQMLSIAFAPLTYSYGGGRAEAKEAVSELTELKEKVPAELRDDFAKVEEVFAESGHAYSNFDEAAFADAVSPIEEWVLDNCPKLR